jgi:hypothetical protein
VAYPLDGAASQIEASLRSDTCREWADQMRWLDSTTFVMILIMATVFVPIAVIHFLAEHVFE